MIKPHESPGKWAKFLYLDVHCTGCGAGVTAPGYTTALLRNSGWVEKQGAWTYPNCQKEGKQSKASS